MKAYVLTKKLNKDSNCTTKYLLFCGPEYWLIQNEL